MAEVGKIYWGADGSDPTNRIIYLSGVQTENSPNLFEQLSRDEPGSSTTIPPWWTPSVTGFDGFISDNVRNKFKFVIENEILPFSCYRLFAAVSCYGSSGSSGPLYTISCKEIENFDLLNTVNVWTMNYMFHDDWALYDSLSFKGNFITSNVSTFTNMFQGCTHLEEVDISAFDMSHAIDCSGMFSGCTSLVTIYAAPNMDFNSYSNLTDSDNMFYNCTALVGGNGTAHGTSTTAANNNKTRARMDKSGQEGYFTVARRTVTVSPVGSGTLTGSGTYDYGTIVTVGATPDENYFIASFSKVVNSVLTPLISEDTVSPQRYSFSITDDIEFRARFSYRDVYQLSVIQNGTNYQIEGTGSYRYLATPTLIADLNEGLISFLGWYETLDSNPVSLSNPYTFKMPANDYTLTALFGDPPFLDDAPYRQFILRNNIGQIFNLTTKDNKIFLNKPDGLGFKKSLSSIRFGNTEETVSEVYDMPEPSGTIVFYSDENSNNYSDYFDFIRFAVKSPLILWYKIPIPDDETKPNVYHIPVELTDLAKSEIDDRTGAIYSRVQFHGKNFWKYTYTRSEITGSEISFYNDSDLEVGVELMLSKGDSSFFTNPVIHFQDNGVDYGICAISGTYTRIILNTKDKEQGLRLYNGSDTEIANPLQYIEFSYADGKVKFPFPKLKVGANTTILFDYDNSGEESRNYVLIFDKEYVSV